MESISFDIKCGFKCPAVNINTYIHFSDDMKIRLGDKTNKRIPIL